MRIATCLVLVGLLINVGCGSKGSNATKPDAAPTDAAPDQSGLQPDDVAPDRASDPLASADLPPVPDAPTAGADAPADGPRADRTGNADVASDIGPRTDVAGGADVVGLADVAGTPDVAGKLDVAGAPDTTGAEAGAPGPARTLGGCPILPPNHIFNTPIDGLPVHANSAAFMTTIGNHNIHLDLGTSTDMTAADYYGIPYNTVGGNTSTWVQVSYSSTDTADMTWDPLPESDCVDQSSAAAHTIVSPCLASKAPKPWLPIPAAPLVEGGIDTDPSQPYGDHHMLIIDRDVCRLWELYHCYPNTKGGWDIFGSATFDLNSNALRPADWTSADAAGFPILPLLLLADEASTGVIKHALRFTISSSSIRNEYVWPARHLTSNGTMSANLPPMGQLFRLKASYAIPASYNAQSKAILQALKTYGMYIADGGSNMYIQGDPNAGWQDSTFSQVQSVGSSQFEAVDLSPIMGRAGFDPNSAAVP